MLDKIKSNLKITWDTEDEELERMLKRGKALIEERTGTAIDFEDDLVAQSLLLDYVRYAYNNSVEYFEENFTREILALQLNEAIRSGDSNES